MQNNRIYIAKNDGRESPPEGDLGGLIDAFYNGETNKEDEQALRNYFNSNDVADELQNEKTLFLQLYENDAVEVPPTLEKKITKTIDRLERQEKEQFIRRKTLKRLWIQAVSVAAGVVLLISIGLFSNRERAEKQVDTAFTQLSEEDRQKIREAEEALLLLSSTFSKGIEQMALVSANLDKARTILNNSINRESE